MKKLREIYEETQDLIDKGEKLPDNSSEMAELNDFVIDSLRYMYDIKVFIKDLTEKLIVDLLKK